MAPTRSDSGPQDFKTMATAARSDGRPRGEIEGWVEDFIKRLLDKAGSPHVVLGPIVWRAGDGGRDKAWYFVVHSLGADRGYRCDELGAVDGLRECYAKRGEVVAALIQQRPPPIVHIEDESETYALRLCETLWPGEKVITALRKAMEAEARS